MNMVLVSDMMTKVHNDTRDSLVTALELTKMALGDEMGASEIINIMRASVTPAVRMLIEAEKTPEEIVTMLSLLVIIAYRTEKKHGLLGDKNGRDIGLSLAKLLRQPLHDAIHMEVLR